MLLLFIVLVLEFESRRGKILNLFCKNIKRSTAEAWWVIPI